MFKIQYRNAQGRMVTAQTFDPAEVRKLVDKARQDVPDPKVSQLRIRQVAVEEITGDFIWADCTDDFTR
jgi:Spy/CpxP family protein refolding chaperone